MKGDLTQRDLELNLADYKVIRLSHVLVRGTVHMRLLRSQSVGRKTV